MSNLYNNPWFSIKKRAPNAVMRLFCFPYAGGSAQVFADWFQSLPDNVEVVAVQYPGRGSRFVEPLIGSCEDMVATLATEIMPFVDKPFAFFGHSNGGLVSFELARKLQQHGVTHQLHHFISAKRAINLPARKAPMHSLPDDEFLRELEDLGGTPPEILAQKELMELFMPILRSDFSLSETFKYSGESKLVCNATLLYGEKDEDIPEEDVMAWQARIEQPVKAQKFPGDHFFINSDKKEVLELLNHQLIQLLAQVPGRMVM
jgi:medium-chain acyl-[acyl-carrier-protein] hydrolase